MDSDQYAATYAELKGKIRWALQTSLRSNYSYSQAMDWAGHYAVDALEQWRIMEETPDYRPYSDGRHGGGSNGKVLTDRM